MNGITQYGTSCDQFLRERERERGRERERDGQINTETDEDRDRQTDSQTNRQTDIDRDSETERRRAKRFSLRGSFPLHCYYVSYFSIDIMNSFPVRKRVLPIGKTTYNVGFDGVINCFLNAQYNALSRPPRNPRGCHPGPQQHEDNDYYLR